VPKTSLTICVLIYAVLSRWLSAETKIPHPNPHILLLPQAHTLFLSTLLCLLPCPRPFFVKWGTFPWLYSVQRAHDHHDIIGPRTETTRSFLWAPGNTDHGCIFGL
jgi:hypothetical protein